MTSEVSTEFVAPSNALKRVLILGSGAGLGGAQTAFRQLVSFALSEGHEVGAIAISDSDDRITTAGNLVLHRCIPVDSTSPIAVAVKLRRVVEASAAARLFAPDVFVSVGLSRSGNFIARYLGDECFSICQDFLGGRASSDIALHKALRSFNAVVLQSASMANNLVAQGVPQRRLSWLPCFPVPPEPGFAHSPSSICRIAYFGRLAPNKGVDVLLEAMKRAELRTDFALDIWGDGPERDNLGALVDTLDLNGRVTLRGRYPSGKEGAALMCSYHALVVPSQFNEGLPLIILEAMAYGIPALVTDVGAIGDCCLDNPDFIMVKPACSGLVEGLKELTRKLESNWFVSDRLQAHYNKHFSFDGMSQRWRRFLLTPRGFFDPTT